MTENLPIQSDGQHATMIESIDAARAAVEGSNQHTVTQLDTQAPRESIGDVAFGAAVLVKDRGEGQGATQRITATDKERRDDNSFVAIRAQVETNKANPSQSDGEVMVRFSGEKGDYSEHIIKNDPELARAIVADTAHKIVAEQVAIPTVGQEMHDAQTETPVEEPQSSVDRMAA